jgi:hypothetical protein
MACRALMWRAMGKAERRDDCDHPLGKFERVILADAWPTEDGNFTPWLALPASIALLGESLNIELEVEAVEHSVGPFRADILARATDEPDHRVIIENQFGRTDHRHLGQILTYLAGIDGAKTVVWIAETIQSDHRAAVDWLNTNTSDEFSFFAIEIELWRIDNSPPAPRFNVVASPNDWTRSARSAARQLGEAELEPRHHVRIAYWASFAEYLKTKGSSFKIRRRNKDAWFWFAIGRAGFGIEATISTDKQRIGVELYMQRDASKSAFRALFADKDAIEREFGEQLEWRELPGRKLSGIALYRHGADLSDEAQYDDLHAWMLAKMERFRNVFAARVRSLSLAEVADSDDHDEPDQ